MNSEKERFEEYILPITESGCHIWVGTTEKVLPNGKRGYGRFTLHGRSLRSHRVSWILNIGKIPNGLCVLHKCDVRTCVNPSHLFLGTKGENNTDRSTKNRNASQVGEKSALAKLTNEEILLIRNDSRYQHQIASDFGIHQTTVGRIKRRVTWGNV